MVIKQLRWTLALVLTVLLAESAHAQPAAGQPDNPPPTRPRLADGILTVVAPAGAEAETFSGPLSLRQLDPRFPEVQGTPNFAPPSETLNVIASQAILRREIWNLEFAFKPLRMITVPVPGPGGKVVNTRIWYLTYRIRYLGQEIKPEPERDRFGHVRYPGSTAVNRSYRRFFPKFVLYDVDRREAYLDRLIPAAMDPIANRERVGRLYDSVGISLTTVPLSDPRSEDGVWGVAMWENVDPRMDHFTILVQGLTNAYRLVPAADGSLQMLRKTLKINFWRPGDSVLEHEEEFRLGIPFEGDAAEQQRMLDLYGESNRLDYSWIFQ